MTQGVRNRRTAGSPLAETLERVSAVRIGNDEIRLSARLGVSDEPGWTTVADLAEDAGLLDEIMARLGRTYGTDHRAFVGTTMFKDCLWRFLAPAITALLTERRLPDLRPENVALSFGESGFASGLAFVEPRFAALPGDRNAGHPDAVILPSDNDLLGGMREALADGYLPALVPALRGLRVRRGSRVMWRAAVDVCAEAFLLMGGGLGREPVALEFAERLLAGAPPLSGPTNYYVLEHEGGFETTRVRNTCCLYYKIGDGACSTCPRTSDAERLRRLAQR